MATLTLRLEVDPNTKKQNVWVKYDSEADALPMEHEEAHRRLVEMLLAGGTLRPEELGTITIEREGPGVIQGQAVEEESHLPVSQPVGAGNRQR